MTATLTIPHSIDSESAALGSAMQSSEHAAAVAATGLLPEHCYRPAHAAVWGAVLRLLADGRAVDPFAVDDALDDDARARLDIGGGSLDELAGMVESAPSSAGAIDAAKRVRSMAGRRRLMSCGGAITRAAAAAADADSAAAAAAGLLDDALDGGHVTSPLVNVPDAADAVLTAWLDDDDDGAAVCPSGLPSLDAALGGGLRAGELVLIAASTGVGKSSVLLSMCQAAADAGRPVLLSSMEMDRAAIGERWLLSGGRVAHPPERLPDGERDAAWRAVERGRRERPSAELILIDDDRRQTCGHIARRARSIDRIGLIAVDYLQLIESPAERETRATELGRIAVGLRALGADLGCPVVAAAQLNRAPHADRTPRAPRLSDLRESGALEATGDVVLLLHPGGEPHDTTPAHAPDRPVSRPLTMTVAKSRRGPSGQRIPLLLHPGAGITERLLA